MTGVLFDWHGLRLEARCSGALWWPEGRWLIVADLHLGKSERMARRGGALLPPYEGIETLRRLQTEAEALEIANDTLYGLGAGVWSRNGTTAYRAGRTIQAGRVWVNTYHQYPAHAAFGGYKQSGIGRENHKMMLDHYQQTKNLLVSYSDDPAGLF